MDFHPVHGFLSVNNSSNTHPTLHISDLEDIRCERREEAVGGDRDREVCLLLLVLLLVLILLLCENSLPKPRAEAETETEIEEAEETDD